MTMNTVMMKLSAACTLIVIAGSMICGCSYETKIDDQGRPVAVQEQSEKISSAVKNNYHFNFDTLPVRLKYVMFDGHEYVVARSDRGLGITHSPRCSCKK